MTSEFSLPSWRRLPIGAEVAPDGGVHFRVHAPERARVRVLLESETKSLAGVGSAAEPEPLMAPEPERDGRVVELKRDDDGYHTGRDTRAHAGSCYRFLLDDDPQPYPDPASRWQPNGPHGSSCVVDPSTYRWRDSEWPGVAIAGQVIYEMHIGTFTAEGSWAAATEQIAALAELGITVIEVLPVADFPGAFGWGYDGVDWFAPTRLYGTPDDFRHFVDVAHGSGIAVILDVVYNHLGPDGNYLSAFNPYFIAHHRGTEWGDSINFDGEHCAATREFVLANVRHWIAEYHLDGLRLDATQSIFDDTVPHVITELVQEARTAAGDRQIMVVAENEAQEAWLARTREGGGAGMDALWNDDFHHSAHVAASGDTEGFFSAYRGAPQEFVSMAKYGWLYQGQLSTWEGKPRGSPTAGLRAAQFVVFTQNHDQIANNGHGRRLHELTSPGRHRALTAMMMLWPQTPMLFQGQEFAASAPFTYFADHDPALAVLVAEGRKRFLSQFATLAMPDVQATLPDPGDPATFTRCKLDHAERELHHEAYAFHRDLIRLRREAPVFGRSRVGESDCEVDGTVLADEAFALRYRDDCSEDRLIIVNLGSTLRLSPVADPLLAPPEGGNWSIVFASESPQYGGASTPPLEAGKEGWHVPAECAIVLAAAPGQAVG